MWKVNPALQPTDPEIALAMTQANFAAANDLLKAGVFKEMGSLGPGEGFAIAEFPSGEEALRLGSRFFPMMLTEMREIISWEKTQEIVLDEAKAAVKRKKK